MSPSHPHLQDDLDSDTCHRSSQYKVTAAADIINQGAGPRHSEMAFFSWEGGRGTPCSMRALSFLTRNGYHSPGSASAES